MSMLFITIYKFISYSLCLFFFKCHLSIYFLFPFNCHFDGLRVQFLNYIPFHNNSYLLFFNKIKNCFFLNKVCFFLCANLNFHKLNLVFYNNGAMIRSIEELRSINKIVTLLKNSSSKQKSNFEGKNNRLHEWSKRKKEWKTI